MTDSLNQDLHQEVSQPEKISVEDMPDQRKFSFDMNTIRNRQKYLLWGIGSCLIGGMVIYGWITMGQQSSTRKPGFKNSITTGSSRINPQETWMYQFRSEAEITKKRLNVLEDTLNKILKINTASKATALAEQAAHHTSSQPSNDPAKAIEEVRQDIKKAQVGEDSRTPIQNSNPSTSSSQDASDHSNQTILPPPPGSTPSPDESVPDKSVPDKSVPNASVTTPEQRQKRSSFRSKSVRKISLSLRNARSNASLKTVDNTIPAGAFAKTVLMGGVDASASISSSSDPRPALLRVIDPGTLPRKFHSDLLGCHVLTACYGDISSERVYMRLEKLTCIERKTGEIIEIKVQGYVAGEDGRTGVRGSVVDRAGESMRNAMVGGFIGGIGDFLSQSRNAVTFSPIAGLAQTNPMGVGDMVKHGAGNGASNALSRYADFYIKRAEQLQPVIQVAAGRQVDIVFTEGVSLNETLYRQALGRSNDQGRYQQIQTINEGTPTSQQSVSDWIGDSHSKIGRRKVKKCYDLKLPTRVRLPACVRLPARVGFPCVKLPACVNLPATAALCISLSVILGACSTPSETFDCQPGQGVGCKSITEVNHLIDQQTFGKETAQGVQSIPMMPHHTASFPPPIISTTSPAIENLKAPDSAIPLSDTFTVQRMPEEYLRVWVAPFQDQQGNLHEGSIVHTVLKPGYWKMLNAQDTSESPSALDVKAQ